MINVILVDDNGHVRKSLKLLLELEEDIQVVATAADGVEAVDKARLHRPDIAVMDISMPVMDGIEAARHIRECCGLTRVIMVTSFDIREYVERALEVGAKGYVLKDDVVEHLAKAIQAIHLGSEYFSEKIATIAMRYLGHRGNDNLAA